MAGERIELNAHLQMMFDGPDAFDRILALRGATYRQHKHRQTMRMEIDGRPYFLKVHGHSGWGEILKNVLRGRIPVTTSRPEVRAIRHCVRLGVATTPLAGWGVRGGNPACTESFLFTEALDGFMHLDELADGWAGLTGRARVRLQRQVLLELAGIARALHVSGMNHRDFYLCHFMLPARDWSQWSPQQPLDLHVIDLHRAQLRRRTPSRMAIKDISGLLFSALDAGYTTRDWLRFLEVYFDRPWRQTLRRSRLWLFTVRWRAVRLYQSEHGKRPPHRGGRASSS